MEFVMHKYKESITNGFKQLYKFIPDALAVSGAISISYGCYRINEPLGFIVMGCLLIGGAIIWSKS
jgi:hypothetical protein